MGRILPMALCLTGVVALPAIIKLSRESGSPAID